MKKPNIIYVFPDQYRLQAMGFWQKPEYKGVINGVTDPVHTPVIDKFADESLVLTQAVSTCPLCSPYRGMLFSGRFPEQNGVKSNCNNMRSDSLKEDITCLTDVLSDQGYSVGYVGKWHLDKPVTNFDETMAFVGDGGSYFPDGSKIGDLDLTDRKNLFKCCWDAVTPKSRRHGIDFWHNHASGRGKGGDTTYYWDDANKKETVSKWSAIADTDVAVSYINNEFNQREKDQPFCLVVGYNPPHSPYSKLEHTDPDMYHKYYSEEKVPDVRSLLNRPNVPEDAGANDWVRYYFSSVSGVDKQFGRLLDAIEASGEKDNTIVVFSADHGDMMGSHDMGAKNCINEESYRIPFIVRYPDKLEHRVEDLMFGGPDVMPTLLSLAGMTDHIPSDLDGKDYADAFLRGEASTVEKPKSSLYIYDYPECQRKGVRTDRYSFVIERDEDGQLKKHVIYDNQEDPYQMNNLEFEDLSEETLSFLKTELGYWLKEANDLWYQERVFDDFIIY